MGSGAKLRGDMGKQSSMKMYSANRFHGRVERESRFLFCAFFLKKMPEITIPNLIFQILNFYFRIGICSGFLSTRGNMSLTMVARFIPSLPDSILHAVTGSFFVI